MFWYDWGKCHGRGKERPGRRSQEVERRDRGEAKKWKGGIEEGQRREGEGARVKKGWKGHGGWRRGEEANEEQGGRGQGGEEEGKKGPLGEKKHCRLFCYLQFWTIHFTSVRKQIFLLVCQSSWLHAGFYDLQLGKSSCLAFTTYWLIQVFFLLYFFQGISFEKAKQIRSTNVNPAVFAFYQNPVFIWKVRTMFLLP